VHFDVDEAGLQEDVKRLTKEVRRKREPARAALGELKVGVEKAGGS
jgi:hypothetical protein